LSGPSSICVGGTTQFQPSTGGTWTSTNIDVATINNQGLVTSIAPGTVQFIYTENGTGCKSDSSTIISVINSVTVGFDGPSTICMNYNTRLTPNTGGFWMSLDEAIATVTSEGLITGHAPGKISFYFTEISTGCKSYLPPNALTVEQCLDPDFTVTFVNQEVSGNISTNDGGSTALTYGSKILISKPNSSIASLNINADGSYTFTADKEGVYTYQVGACVPPYTSGCPSTELIIHVFDLLSNTPKMAINTDFATVYEMASPKPDYNLTSIMENDKCVKVDNCILNNSSANIIDNPSKGIGVMMSDSRMSYQCNTVLLGTDTMVYELCDMNANCNKAKLIMTINAENANNTVVAVDDLLPLSNGGSATINVKTNDSDPVGDMFSIIPQGTLGNPVITSFGTYALAGNGTMQFNAAAGFSGPAEIIYEICDQNTDIACAKATVHLIVAPDFSLQIRMYLEGALIRNGNQNGSDGRPLMRDELRNSPFTGLNSIPVIDPYNSIINGLDLSPKFVHVGAGGNAEYRTITDSLAVFSTTGANAIVDWVFIELRSKDDSSLVIGTRSALLQRDGDVVDLDGVSAVRFPGISVDSFYVVVRHRNHIGAMSLKVGNSSLVDFTKTNIALFDFGTSLNNGMDYTGLSTKNSIKTGYRSLWAGDFDSNHKIKFTNPNDDQNILFYEVLSHPGNVTSNANYNFAIGYYQGDYDMNSKAKYDNPDDDKNFLFAQVLLYPLNPTLLSNFNFLSEQVPTRSN
jgi:hypothetical protein